MNLIVWIKQSLVLQTGEDSVEKVQYILIHISP